MTMHDKGYTSAQIAEIVKKSVEEVETVIKKKRACISIINNRYSKAANKVLQENDSPLFLFSGKIVRFDERFRCCPNVRIIRLLRVIILITLGIILHYQKELTSSPVLFGRYLLSARHSWEFIAQFLASDYQDEKLNRCLPLRRDTMEHMLEEAGNVDYAVDADGNEIPIVKSEIGFEGEESIEVYRMEEEEKKQLLRLIDTASLNDAIDYTLYNIVLEEAQSYFAGDKTLDEVVDMIQRRASLYVAERR